MAEVLVDVFYWGVMGGMVTASALSLWFFLGR